MSPRKELPNIPGQCRRCGKPSGEFKYCDGCRERNRIAQNKFYGRTTDPKTCEGDGCKEVIPPLTHFCRACAKKRKLERDRKLKAKIYKEDRIGLKPHRPAPPLQRKPLVSEEEQQRLDAEASRRDREWNRKFFKDAMGLESAPGQPLASKVVTPPPEVWEQLQREFRPQRDTGGMVLPSLHRDMVYD
jgi:hypothetical protein